jgi:hypothetical protein
MAIHVAEYVSKQLLPNRNSPSESDSHFAPAFVKFPPDQGKLLAKRLRELGPVP